MNAHYPLKSALVSSIFALSALMNPAHSAATEEIIEKPACDLDFLMTDTLKDKSYLPSGIKGSSAKWNMEIYIKASTGQWVLLGQSKDPKVVAANELCQLAYGRTPYTQTTWYQQNFLPMVNSPKVAVDKMQPQPRVN